MKTAAAVMIFVSSAIISYLLCARLSRRVEELDAALELIALIKSRISYFREPLEGLLPVLRADNMLLARCSCESFSSAWDEAFNNSELAIGERARIVMLRFGMTLGGADVDGQRALCDETAERIRQIRTSAAAEREKYFKVAAVLPVFSGAAIILMFI